MLLPHYIYTDVTSNQENSPESSSVSSTSELLTTLRTQEMENSSIVSIKGSQTVFPETCNETAANMYTEREQILSAVFGTIIFILLLLIAGENLFLVIWFICKRRSSNKRSTLSVEPTYNSVRPGTAVTITLESIYDTVIDSENIHSAQSDVRDYSEIIPDHHDQPLTIEPESEV